MISKRLQQILIQQIWVFVGERQMQFCRFLGVHLEGFGIQFVHGPDIHMD